MPDVTVLMAVYNGERFLRESVESILEQTHGDFEFLIVDDGSTDRSRDVIASYDDRRIKVLVNPRNLGLGAALNRGLEVARGEFIARQDADDRSAPNRLERQVEIVQALPELALLGTQAYRINADGVRIGTVRRPCEPVSIRWFSLFDNPFIHTSVLFRRALVQQNGWRYDEAFPYGQDFALWSRILQAYPVMNTREPLVEYRLHSLSKTGPAQRGIPLHQGSVEYLAWLHRLLALNYTQVFGDSGSPGEIELIARFLVGVDRATLPAFLACLQRMLLRYMAAYPTTQTSDDFRETIARHYETVATRVTPPSRALSWAVYRAAFAYRPSVVWSLSVVRFFSLTIMGRAGVERLKMLRNARMVASA